MDAIGRFVADAAGSAESRFPETLRLFRMACS
jgi:coenzyme F420-reducing hydrogenase delta subunit